MKLRDDAGFDLRAIDKLQEEQRTSETKTEDKVNELIAANAATQATVTALAAENAGIKALLTQLVELQTRGASENHKTEPKLTSTEYSTETETDNRTDQPTETETDTNTEHNTELYTEMERMGVLPQSASTVTYSHDLPVTALFTELENANVLKYTDFLQYCDTEQRRTRQPNAPHPPFAPKISTGAGCVSFSGCAAGRPRRGEGAHKSRRAGPAAPEPAGLCAGLGHRRFASENHVTHKSDNLDVPF